MSFLNNCWYVACWGDDLVPGKILPMKIAGEPIALFRDAEGRAAALKDRCSHRFAPLSKGRLEDGGLRCMYHGLKFGANGKCIEIPGQDTIPRQADVRAYPVVERNSWVWLWLGQPDAADEDLIPVTTGLDHPDWAQRHGWIDYDASYMLVNDNLLDFSHLSYVHAQSFGAGTGWAETRPTIVALPRGVRIERWLENQPRSNSRPDIADRFIDHYSIYDYVAPGVLHSTAYSFKPGTAERFAGAPPTSEVKPLYGTVTSQAVTPLTDTTCRYFFSRGLPRDEATPERLDQMMRVTEAAFAEDREMIEAQQKVILDNPDERMFVTTADRALILFRRTMQRLTNETREPAAAA